MFKTGLVSVSFRGHSPEEILRCMQKVGLKFIEWGSDVHAPVNDGKVLAALSALQRKFGIRCCSYGTYFRIGQEKSEEILQYIRAASILETRVLRIWAGGKGSAEYTLQEKARFLDDCRRLADIAEKQSVVLGLECHHHTMTDDADAAWELMTRVNSENFRMYWQPNQFKSQDENLKSAEKLAAYTHTVHVFNWQGNERFPLSSGMEIWQKYLKCFRGNETLLLEFMPDDSLNSLPAEANSLFTLTGGRKS